MRRSFMQLYVFGAALLVACGADGTPATPLASDAAPPVDVVRVASAMLEVAVRLPGELLPFETVDLHARAEGFVQRIDVDRGSLVHEGDVLVRLAAPELRARRAGAEARLTGERSTAERLRAAGATPGAVAGHDLEIAASREAASSAEARSLAALEGYLVVRAPFDGVITDRFVHPGALVGPSGDRPLLRLEQITRLRLVVAVPEYAAGRIADGREITFHVRAFPGRAFVGTVARVARSVDASTRTMPVELDVDNAAGLLAPGMYADVEWQVVREGLSLFVPARAIVQSTSAVFVNVVREGRAHRVPVDRGMAQGELVEVFGELTAEDLVVARAREDLADGQALDVRAPAAP